MNEKQVEALAAWLMERGRITGLQALRQLGIYRLAARIFDLRELAWRIETINRPGKTAQYRVIEIGNLPK